MTEQDMMIYGIAVLCFIAVAGLGLALTSGTSSGAAAQARQTGGRRRDREEQPAGQQGAR